MGLSLWGIGVLLVLLSGASASYLDPPFFAFSGTFYTNPGTLNNFISNFNASNPVVPWWNPKGVNYFQLQKTPITSAFDSSGQWLSSAVSTDCLFSASLRSSASAKLVDIDPDDQFASQIFGMVITISLPGGASLSGKWSSSALRGQWIAAQCPLPHWAPKYVVSTVFFGSFFFSLIMLTPPPRFGNNTRQRAGDWQSVLTNVKTTGDLSCSPILRELLSISPTQLSIKIDTDDFNNDDSDPLFLTGRLRGVIGPYFAGEPTANVPDRVLFPGATPGAPSVPSNCPLPTPVPFNAAAMRVTRTTIAFDLGNAVPLATPHGPSLFPALTPHYSRGGVLYQLVNCTASTDQETYVARAGITVCQLSPSQASELADSPVSLLDGSGNAVLVEPSDGIALYAEPRNHRLEIGQQANVSILARQFGLPLSGLVLDLALVPSPMAPQPNRVNNAPVAGLQLPVSVTTASDGTALLQITGGNVTAAPGLPAPRVPLDSQIYFISLDPSLGMRMARIDVLVFNSHEPIPQPTWDDVEPIFALYGMLFPGMDAIVNLTDEATVVGNAQSILYTLNLDFDDSSLMPVTRDLSASHKALMETFLKNVHPAAHQDPDIFADAALRRVASDPEQQQKIRRLCPFLAARPQPQP